MKEIILGDFEFAWGGILLLALDEIPQEQRPVSTQTKDTRLPGHLAHWEHPELLGTPTAGRYSYVRIPNKNHDELE